MTVSEVSVRSFSIRLESRSAITEFVEKHHYSHSINGCIADYCFAMYRGGEMIGAMFYGRMAMANQWVRFGTQEADVIELRRLVCVDDTPKNAESHFIGWTLRWLKRNTKIKTVVSYADLEYGHTGVIYKASNFDCLGKQSGARVIVFDGKRYHDKAIRTKYNGVLKPFALRIKQALESGEARYIKTAGKICYSYQLRDRK